MNELQQKQLTILKEFIRVCEKHNLKYYLLFGSVLGAVRHNGFIPWDDDIDLCMPRPDFDKLLTLKNEFSDPYFLQHPKTDRGYTYTFAKLRDSNTTFVEKPFQRHNINHGIFIDIFPLDGMARKKKTPHAEPFKSLLLWFMYFFTFLGHFWRKPNWKKPHWTILGYLCSLIFLPFIIGNWMAKLINLWAKSIKYDKASLVGPFLTIYMHKAALPKEWFGEGVPIKFEDIEVIIPSEYELYLKTIYGDYMKLPPVEKQVGHHAHTGCSTTISYKNYK